MKDLSALFGMPITLNESTGVLETADNRISWEGYSRKLSGKMFGLLASSDYKTEDEPYYDFYKSIVENDKRSLF